MPLLHSAISTIPVIDIESLYSQTALNLKDAKVEKVAEKLGKALHECGFAYLVNHGIPQNIIFDAFAESKSFFEMLPGVKLKYAKEDIMDNYHGYTGPGREVLNKDSMKEIRESFDLFGNSRYYPSDEVPRFEEALTNLENACRSLDVKLLQLLALSIKLEDTNFFNSTNRNLEDRSVPSLNTFRTLYYPPIEENTAREGVIRCGEHTDFGTITLLFQDSIGGLQVKSPENQWIDAPYIPNSIVINTGDLLEAWTGGYFPATAHRVLAPADESVRQTSRQSMAFFLHPDNEVMITPLESEILKTSPLDESFKPISSFDHAMRKVGEAHNHY